VAPRAPTPGADTTKELFGQFHAMRIAIVDPELRIRARPPIVLRRTTEAVDFIRKVALSTPDRPWQDLLQRFEAARDKWSAMEAVVHLELLLEAGGLLIEEKKAYASRSRQGRSRAA